MKKVFMGLFVVLVLFFSSQSMFAQDAYSDAYNFGQQLFYDALRDANRIPYKLQNSTGSSIQEIYISLSSSDYWGDNLYQNEALFQSGYEVDLKSDNVGPYDFRLVDENGREYVKTRVRITTDLVIQFTQDDLM